MHGTARWLQISVMFALMSLTMWGVVFGWKGFFGALVLLFALLCLFSACLVNCIAVRKGGLTGRVGLWHAPNAEKQKQMHSYMTAYKKKLNQLGAQAVSLVTADGLTCKAYSIPGQAGETRAMLLLHGYGASAGQMLSWAAHYHERYGMAVLMPDARAHGESEGRATGLGWLERADGQLWLDWLVHTLGSDARIGLHGYSTGGMQALMMGDRLPEQVRVLICERVCASASDFAACLLREALHLPVNPFLPLMKQLSRPMTGCDWRQASALAGASALRVPCLLIAHEEDPLAPEAQAAAIYDALPPQSRARLTLTAAQQAGHNTVNDETARAIEQMIQTHLSA